MKFRIGIGSPFPGDGETDIKTVTSLWHEACDYLAIEYKNGTSPFCIEICDLVSVLNVGATCMTDNAAFRKRYEKKETNGFWCYLNIIYRKKDFPGSRPPVEDICYFLQNLFLALNLCMAGGCHLYRCTLPANPKLEAWAPSLNGHPIESAWRAAARWGWPLLQTLNFEKVWQWLERVSLLDAVVAKSPAQVAGFALIEIAALNVVEPKDIIMVSQTLETLFVEEHDGISRRLKNRIKLVLGEPPTDKKWLTKLYETRSKIVHGAFPVVRPIIGYYAEGLPQQLQEELSLQLDRGFSVIIAVLQDMIINSSVSYKFVENVMRDPTRGQS